MQFTQPVQLVIKAFSNHTAIPDQQGWLFNNRPLQQIPHFLEMAELSIQLF